MSARIVWLLLSLLCVFISGCAASSTRVNGIAGMACEQIAAQGMESLFSGGPAVPDLRVVLSSMFGGDIEGAPQPEVVAAGRLLESTFYQWEDADAAYQLTTLDKIPRRAAATFKLRRAPTLARTLECLGEPDYYSAHYKRPPDGQPVLGVDLFYTGRGMMVFIRIPGAYTPTRGSTPDPIELLSGRSPVSAIGWVQPGGIKAMDWHFQPYGGVPDATAQEEFWEQNQAYYATFQPWPGSIEEVMLTDPDVD